ncbi:hypothetical protein B5K06_32575 [Rhizobium grahamii]|uniref:Transposase IS116/IS110/IS902 C-terminal domain-containing protein n=1 Tax=Rhizobium grahamii TaxID=1120045 RepID=A0A370KFK9_9HYPH|nr:transposase [Rhizobium grahamii]RDJ01923.1 hypothetical protein B5K06_32575 [Rhizobium grahamii]
MEQIKDVERMRYVLLSRLIIVASTGTSSQSQGISSEFLAVFGLKGCVVHFDNRRQVAAYAGLAPTPWEIGQADRDQGVSKAGNPKLRTTLVQVVSLWLHHRPDSALSL